MMALSKSAWPNQGHDYFTIVGTSCWTSVWFTSLYCDVFLPSMYGNQISMCQPTPSCQCFIRHKSPEVRKLDRLLSSKKSIQNHYFYLIKTTFCFVLTFHQRQRSENCCEIMKHSTYVKGYLSIYCICISPKSLIWFGEISGRTKKETARFLDHVLEAKMKKCAACCRLIDSLNGRRTYHGRDTFYKRNISAAQPCNSRRPTAKAKTLTLLNPHRMLLWVLVLGCADNILVC